MIQVVTFNFKLPEDALVVNTTSRSNNWSTGLSPFFLGPCKLYDDYVGKNVENSWQYSKVYDRFTDEEGEPTEEYFEWAKEGWNNPRAVRYPMGHGIEKPLYSLWDGKKYSYVVARKKIYIPLYSNAVRDTQAFAKLKSIYESKEADQILYLQDFDSHNLPPKTFEYINLWNNPKIKCGHGYVLAMMLEGIIK